MRVRFLWISFTLFFALLGPGESLASDQACPLASTPGFCTLEVDGEQVRIYRDEFGVPHIFADSNRGLFVGYGYAIAQDRLWQLELFRRAARGQLAEILGTNPVTNLGGGGAFPAQSIDISRRTRLYTPLELDEQFAMLTDEEKEIFTAYADGINRYLTDVVTPDPASKLPYEFTLLGIGIPEAWTAGDVVATVVYQARFGEVGGQEGRNRDLLNALVLQYGQDTGSAIFNDVFWLDDPDSPVTVPAEGAIGKRQQAQLTLPLNPDQLVGASQPSDSVQEAADQVLEPAEIPTGIGSHGWVVSAAKSAAGSAMLYGGPQVDFNTPEILHDVQLSGGNGFDVVGAAVAGVPAVVAGRTNHIAFSPMTGSFGDNTDTYLETLCNPDTYLFNGVCTAFEKRTEVIYLNIQHTSSVNCTVRRTVHGPVVAPPAPPPCSLRVAWSPARSVPTGRRKFS